MAEPRWTGQQLRRTFQGVLRRRVGPQLVSNRREQAVGGGHGLSPRVEQDEGAGAVRVLGLTRLAALAQHRGLLVTQAASDGDTRQRAVLHVPACGLGFGESTDT